MPKLDLPKTLFYVVLSMIAFGVVFGYGLYLGANRTPVFMATVGLVDNILKSVLLVAEESSTLAKTRPKHFLQPARYDGHGVIVNDVPGGERELILLAGFFDNSNEIRLIRRDGRIVQRWPVSFSDLFADPSYLSHPPATDWNVDTNAALALPDGSIVFSFEYAGLVKLDRCGQLVWTVERPTHHSVELAQSGGFWVPSRREHNKGSTASFPPFTPPYAEDTLLRVSDSGEVIEEISVPDLLYENGLDVLLTATGDQFSSQMAWDQEIVHLNKIEELTSDIAEDFPDFESGDLALSLRNYNLVMVVDANSRKIKWWRIGPWRRQHDPEFKAGGTIVIFNNNTYWTDFGDDPGVSHLDIPRVSNVMEIDPATGEERIVYGNQPGQELLSVIRGKVELTPRGGLLITEFEGGRVFETDSAGQIVWSYLNRYSADEVAEINEARLYPEGYFDVMDWSCTGLNADNSVRG